MLIGAYIWEYWGKGWGFTAAAVWVIVMIKFIWLVCGGNAVGKTPSVWLDKRCYDTANMYPDLPHLAGVSDIYPAPCLRICHGGMQLVAFYEPKEVFSCSIILNVEVLNSIAVSVKEIMFNKFQQQSVVRC